MATKKVNAPRSKAKKTAVTKKTTAPRSEAKKAAVTKSASKRAIKATTKNRLVPLKDAPPRESNLVPLKDATPKEKNLVPLKDAPTRESNLVPIRDRYVPIKTYYPTSGGRQRRNTIK